MCLLLLRSFTPVHSAPELLDRAKPSFSPGCGRRHPPAALGSWLGQGVKVCLSTFCPGEAGNCPATAKVSLSSLCKWDCHALCAGPGRNDGRREGETGEVVLCGGPGQGCTEQKA